MENLEGRVFGRLTVEAYAGKSKEGRPLWRCLCSCGKHTEVRAYSLKGNHTRSCGCLVAPATKKANTRHGYATRNAGVHRTYISWAKCKRRCRDTKDIGYPQYGGRGIDMADCWFKSFERFLADMGECPPKMTLDRINNEVGYIPGNCRWASATTQANNKRNNLVISTNIGVLTLAEVVRYMALAPLEGNAGYTEGYRRLRRVLSNSLKRRSAYE